MMGEGIIYRDRQCLRVQFPECGEDIAAELPAAHLKTQYIIGIIAQWDTPPTVGEPQIYQISFPIMADLPV